MKLRFFSNLQPEARKNDLHISLITHDLDSAYTLPTLQDSLRIAISWSGGKQEVKAP